MSPTGKTSMNGKLIRGQNIINLAPVYRLSCKYIIGWELMSPSLIGLLASVDVKQHYSRAQVDDLILQADEMMLAALSWRMKDRKSYTIY